VLRSVIELDAQSQAAGWHTDVVVLARGAGYFLIFRTEHAEHVLDAYAWYAETVEKLATKINSPRSKMQLPARVPEISAWLRRESARALAEQARVTLQGPLHVFSMSPTMSTAELARGLHTDRGNLSRLLSKAAASTRSA
jgi:hypothetical protein